MKIIPENTFINQPAYTLGFPQLFRMSTNANPLKYNEINYYVGSWLFVCGRWVAWVKGFSSFLWPRLLPCRVYFGGANFHAQLKRLFNENKCA